MADRLSRAHSVFWDDLARDLEDPEFLREYVLECVRVATIDRLVNDLDDARAAAGLSKADLARAIGVQAASIRRLFTSGNVSPTVGTVAEVAAALGMRVTLEPLSDDERAQVTTSLQEGRTTNPQALAKLLYGKRAAS